MPSIDFAAAVTRFNAGFSRLIEPETALINPEQRHAARLLAVLVIAFAVYIGATLAVQLTNITGFPAELIPYTALGLAMLILLYGLSRTRHYVRAAWLMVLTVLVCSGLVVLYDPLAGYVPLTLVYPVVAVVVGSLIFRLWASIVLALIVMGFTAAMMFTIPQPLESTFAALHLNGLLCGVVLVTALVRGRDQRQIRIQAAALAEEHNLLQAVIDHIPDYVYIKDRESRFVLVNRAVLNRMGVPMAELVGHSDLEMLGRDVWDSTRAEDLRIMGSGQPLINLERHWLNDNGNLSWWLVTKAPLYDKQGQLIGLVGVDRNITERKEAELRLADERSLLQAILDNVPDQIYVKDTDSRFRMVNPATLRRHGFERMEEIIGKDDYDLLSHDRATMAMASEQKIFKQGAVVVNEEVSYERDGVTRWNLVNKVPLRDANGIIIGLVGVNRDITEMKKVEKALTEERNLLRTIIDNIPDAIYVKDTESRFLVVNDVCWKLNGLNSMEEIIGKTDYDLLTPEIADFFRNQERHIMETGMPIVALEQSGVNAYGKEFAVLLTKVPIYDSQGNVTGLVGINHDITGLKVAEQHRMELALERERVVILQRFISDMSHDLRNPLATVKVSLYLLARMLDMPERRQHHLEVVNAQVERLEMMVDDLLSMAHLDEATDEFVLRLEDVGEVVTDVVAHQQTLAARREQTLSLDVEAGLPAVACDRGKLSRAVTNLVANALNYTPVGGRVQVRVYGGRQRVCITIEDNGIGISQEDLPHIFERFYRADKARGTETGGTGLGLAITQRIIEGHSGEISVTSTPGEGSVFTISLPVAG